MESLEGLCFTHLCSYLFFNELLVLRLVSTSIKGQLEGKELARNVQQTRALIFPSYLGDPLPGERTCIFLSSTPTKDARNLVRSESHDRQASKASTARLTENGGVVSQDDETLIRTDRLQAPLTIPDAKKPSSKEDSNKRKEWNSCMFFRRFLPVPSSCVGIRELCLYWQDDDQPRRQSCALRALLKVCAPSLESLICSGSCLAVWRYSFPLVVDFPALKRLLIISGLHDSELSVRHYREQLTWHVLGRCRFPACLEFRWMDFFSETLLETYSDQVSDDGGSAELGQEDEAEELGFRWHEIILHQVNRLTTLLSSMRCLRDFTFTADSRYSIIQILSYLATRQEKHSISTLEVIPAYPNIKTLDRDWLLPPLPDADVSGEEHSATLASVTTLRILLRNCSIEDLMNTGIIPVLRDLCPYASISVFGSIKTFVENASEIIRLITAHGMHAKPIPGAGIVYDSLTSAVEEQVSQRRYDESFISPVGDQYDGSPDMSGREISTHEEPVGDKAQLGTEPLCTKTAINSSSCLSQQFCAAPFEIIFSVPDVKASALPCSSACVKFVRLTGVGNKDECAWLGINQTLKKLLRLKSIVLPSIRIGVLAPCPRPVADKIQKLVSCFPHVILSAEGYGTGLECLFQKDAYLSTRISLSLTDFCRPQPHERARLSHAFSSIPAFLATEPFPSGTSTEVVGLQIHLLNGILSSDVSVFLALLSRHPGALFLRLVDTWSATACRKPPPYAEDRLFSGVELDGLLKHNKNQIKVFEYMCAGPVCWQREAGLCSCNPIVPRVLGKEFYLYKEVAFLAGGGEYPADESGAFQQIFSYLYVRRSFDVGGDHQSESGTAYGIANIQGFP